MTNILEDLRLDRDLDFAPILKREIKAAQLYKSSVTDSFKLKTLLIEKHAELIDRLLCSLITNVQLLFCLKKMIISEDQFLGGLPQISLSIIQQFLQKSGDSNLLGSISSSSVQISTPSTDIFLAFADIIQGLREFNLYDYALNYSYQISGIEKMFLNDLHRFKELLHFRTDDIIARNFFDTEYFSQLQQMDTANRLRINDLITEHNLIVDKYKGKKKFHDHIVNTAQYVDRMIKDIHKTGLEQARLKNEPVVSKILKTITEEKNNRALILENLKVLYYKTLENNQKKWRQLKETRYKREAAVQGIIDRYDRDYSTEYRIYEDLSNKFKILTQKSNKLSDDIRSYNTRYYPIRQFIQGEIDTFMEKRYKICAQRIQKWWRKITSECFIIDGSESSVAERQRINSVSDIDMNIVNPRRKRKTISKSPRKSLKLSASKQKTLPKRKASLKQKGSPKGNGSSRNLKTNEIN